MGNTGGRRSNSKNDAITEAASRCSVVITARKQQRRREVGDEEEQTARARRRRRRPAGGVPPRAGGGGAGTVVTVKVVMTRKDAEALAARMNARARKVRMVELKGELWAGGGGASPASCWSPQLAPIKEM